MGFASQPVELGSGQTYRTPQAPAFSINPSSTSPGSQTGSPTPVPTSGGGSSPPGSSLDNILAANPNLVELLGGSGSSPGGATSGDNTHGPENAGQPGSAGVAPADGGLLGNTGNTLEGLASSTIGSALGLGPGLAVSAIGMLAQQGILGPGFTNVADSPQAIENMSIDPGAYGLANAGVAASGQMTTDDNAAAKASATNTGQDPGAFSTEGDNGAGTGGGTGTGGGMGASSGEGGTGGDSSAGGGGGYVKGGSVDGPAPKKKDRDNVTISAQAGEHVMSRAAVKLFGREKLDLLNRMGEFLEGEGRKPKSGFAQGGEITAEDDQDKVVEQDKKEHYIIRQRKIGNSFEGLHGHPSRRAKSGGGGQAEDGGRHQSQ